MSSSLHQQMKFSVIYRNLCWCRSWEQRDAPQWPGLHWFISCEILTSFLSKKTIKCNPRWENKAHPLIKEAEKNVILWPIRHWLSTIFFKHIIKNKGSTEIEYGNFFISPSKFLIDFPLVSTNDIHRHKLFFFLLGFQKVDLEAGIKMLIFYLAWENPG